MAAPRKLYAVYDPDRDAYIVPSSENENRPTDVVYRFGLQEPNAVEPRSVAYIDKMWQDAQNETLHQAFPIGYGYFVYEDTFKERIQELIRFATERSASENLDLFTCIVEIAKQYIVEDGLWHDESWFSNVWWYDYGLDLEKTLSDIAGLWTLGPEDAYFARWR